MPAGRVRGHYRLGRHLRRLAGELVHEARGGQRDADRGRQARGDADPPPGPDRPAPLEGRGDRRRGRRDRLQGAVEPLAQIPLVIDAHGSFPSARSGLSLSLASAREAWLLTLPTEHPRVTATSVSVMSIQYRSTTTSRCPSGTAINPALSADRSSCRRVMSPPPPGPGPATISCTAALKGSCTPAFRQ